MEDDKKRNFKQLTKQRFDTYEEAKKFVDTGLVAVSGHHTEHRGRVRKRSNGKFDGIVFYR